ncbi:MAG: nucleotidyltransferase domain-containing protein [Roseburia sp.]|nr:nucleotidyltransferase domain-containing protein [Anaeroplasma bactoclasticum]MCM1197084.1 nucleotidyltransferase domain-containing protein [Roseburia sp.]MCM1557834.1 nucleotidyltransferase domain-containing protein [Anaeroplasma bactoclasticum]
MEELEKRIEYCELIVPKKVGKLIEKILRFYDLNISHERFKGVIYSNDEFQTPLEEKIKNYYDAYMFLLMNHKTPFTSSIIQKFYYIIFEKEIDPSLALKISSKFIYLSNESKIFKAIDLHLFVYSLLEEVKEYERWMISLMFFNYILVKEGIPCVYFVRSDLEKYLAYQGNQKKLKELLYNVVIYSKFQKKSYTNKLKNISVEDIDTFFLKNREYIQETYKIEHIFLYGSFAKNTARKDSDIDLLVVFKEDMNYEDKMNYKDELVKYLTKEFCRYVDIQEIFECIPKEIILEATKTKKLL